jgi:hypothetical protein
LTFRGREATARLPGLVWTADLDGFLGIITEIDLADAGMTVAEKEGLLPPETIVALWALPKKDRSAAIGRLSRDLSVGRKGTPTLADKITEGIRKRLEAFLEVNEVGLDRLLSVKRDAVFVTGPPPGTLSLPDGSRFVVKSSWTAFTRLGEAREVELYCVPRRKLWTIKGISEEKRPLHGPFIVRVILEVLRLAEMGEYVEAAATLQQFRADYVSLRLPLGYFREFNAGSAFRLRRDTMQFLLAELDANFTLRDLDVMHNLRAVVAPLARALA